MQELFTPGGIIGIIGIIATGVCTVLVIDRKTMREGMEDLRARVGDLEKERADLRLERDALTAQIEEKVHDLEALGRVVTGEAHWVIIEQLIRELIERYNRLQEKVGAVLRRVEGPEK